MWHEKNQFEQPQGGHSHYVNAYTCAQDLFIRRLFTLPTKKKKKKRYEAFQNKGKCLCFNTSIKNYDFLGNNLKHPVLYKLHFFYTPSNQFLALPYFDFSRSQIIVQFFLTLHFVSYTHFLFAYVSDSNKELKFSLPTRG